MLPLAVGGARGVDPTCAAPAFPQLLAAISRTSGDSVCHQSPALLSEQGLPG